MTASPVAGGGDYFSGHREICNCPVCTGIGLDEIPGVVAQAGEPAASNPLSSLPQLSSRTSATAKLYLDFDGNFQASWGSWSNVYTPVYDQDGDAASFSAGELSSIREIWARVSEDYAPFNIDVTTIAPGSQADRVVAHIAIGGNSTDWYGSSAGGVAFVGGFSNFASNVGYVFEQALGNGHAKYVAEAAAHEAGHLFGLTHQAKWSGTTLTASYSSGTGDWAPIMGVGYYATRTTWHNGPTSGGPAAYQDDLSILAGAGNGFGYRPDDYGSTIAAAARLPVNAASVNVRGLIGRSDDQDVFSFSTAGGTVDFTLAVDAQGPNLDAVLELRSSTGSVLATAAPGASYSASLSHTLGAGTFYLVARGMGDYGDVGQYTIAGTVPAAAVGPELSVLVAESGLASGGTVHFGATNVGAAVNRTITIVNDGTSPLTLALLDPATLPTGYTLVSNLAATNLAAGQSTSLVLQLAAATSGTYAGAIHLVSNDSDENPFTLQLDGTVAVPFVPLKRIIDNGAPNNTIAGGWTRIAGKGYEGDIHSAVKGSGSKYVTWTFNGLPSGQYAVYATWTVATNNATNAPFSIHNGSGSASLVKINQRQAPTVTDDGAKWKFLTSVTVNNGWAMVKLTNNANGTVVADAIRILQMPIGALTPARSPVAANPFVLASTVGPPADSRPPAAITQVALAPDAEDASHYVWSQTPEAPENALLEETLDLLSQAHLADDSNEGESHALDAILASGRV